MSDPFGVHIGAREIYDQVVGIRDDVRSLVQDREDTDRALMDHDVRIKALEKWRYALPVGAVSAVVAGLAGLGHSAGLF